MHQESLDARPWLGKQAVLEIVDARAGGGETSASAGSRSVTSRRTRRAIRAPGRRRYDGSGPARATAEHRAAAAEPKRAHGKPGDDGEVPLDDKLVGAIGRMLDAETRRIRDRALRGCLALSKPDARRVAEGPVLREEVSTAAAVARYVAANFDRLSSVTKLWRDTWYDSTLPYWFLNRTFANTSVLATTTCYRLADGRFWAWEGVGCCPALAPTSGTTPRRWAAFSLSWSVICANGSISGSRLDPKTGVIRFRGEFGDTFAVDGQCGTILRAYREHQMSPDDSVPETALAGYQAGACNA